MMLVQQIALLVLGYALLSCSSATHRKSSTPTSRRVITSHRTKFHHIHSSLYTCASHNASNIHANATSFSMAHLSHTKPHTKHTASTSSVSSMSTISTMNTTAMATTTTSGAGSCPTYTTTLAAKKRCPVIDCGPRPMAQGLGGSPPVAERCVLESTTTIPCGCPTPMATTTVFGGCDAGCPPQGCQIAWVTATPIC